MQEAMVKDKGLFRHSEFQDSRWFESGFGGPSITNLPKIASVGARGTELKDWELEKAGAW